LRKNKVYFNKIMHNSKIDQLLEFLKEDPNDSFTLYALALEYEKSDQQRAGEQYNLLLRDHPGYLATYYHAGKFYEKSDRDLAKKIFQDGMHLAQKLGKQKAYNELQSALNLLLDEDYE
jgi:hypothetical protein